MLPLNPLLAQTPLRAQRGVIRLADLIWHDPIPLAVEATASTPEVHSLASAQKRPRRPVRDGETWGRLYDQRWSRIKLPAANGRQWLRWDEQGEATLHVDGVPFYGFDIAHRYCQLPAGTREVWVESLCVQAAIWHPDAKGLDATGNLFRGAQLLRRDDEAWHAYHDFNCLYDWMIDLRAREHPGIPRDLRAMEQQPPLTDVSPLYRKLLRELDTALDAFDTGGVAALRRALAASYSALRDDKPLAHAALTGHSHLDLVWLWNERTGEGKAVHTFANANRLMSLYPEFRFAYSQPLSYEAVGRRSPELFRAMRRRLRSGQWEATGGMLVESDSNVPCGEGLARTFILGQQSFEKLSGRRSRVLWLPDLFGFSACLPQLMRLSGVDYFFTTKTTWNTTNRFPHSSFVWRGPGGHAVVSHVTQGVQFNNAVTVEQLRSAAHQNQQGDIHPEFLMPNGWGDGGGGPSEEMCERARRLTALRGLPSLKWDQPEAFFDRLSVKRANLPALDGEIYLEYHRGTYTTQSAVKAHFRALERTLQLREASLVATGRGPDASLDHAWQRMVFAQFHDFIPGSSIPEVYAEGLPELAALSRGQTELAGKDLAAKGEACVFNPLPVPRQAVVKGRVLSLPPLSGVSLAKAVVVETPAVEVSGLTLRNGRVEARLDARGDLAALSVDGRTVAFTGASSLVSYADIGANFSPWDIDRAALSLGTPARAKAVITAEKNALVVSRSIGSASKVALRYSLDPGASTLRLTLQVDWQEKDTLLKLHFPTAYRGREVRCGTAFGSVLRAQLAVHTQAEAMWEWPMSRWATVSDDGERAGLFVVTEAKYGVNCRDGNLGLTLLRSPLHVGYEDHARPYQRQLSRLPAPTTLHTDIGTHTIELALGFYDLTAPREEQPAVLAETLFSPVLPYEGRPLGSSFLGLEGGDTLIPAWAKPEGRDRWTLRLHEVGGQRGNATLKLAPGWRARKTNLMAEPIGAALRGSTLGFAPYEIISLELTRS